MLTGLLQLAYNTADVVVVGRFAGSEALAAVGSTGSLINLLLNVFIGLSMGSGVMVARHIGAGNEERIRNCTHTAMLLSIISGVFIGFFGFFMSGKILVLMGSPEDVLPLATLYLKIYFTGCPGSMVYNFGSAIVRATGDTKTAFHPRINGSCQRCAQSDSRYFLPYGCQRRCNRNNHRTVSLGNNNRHPSHQAQQLLQAPFLKASHSQG